MIWALPAVPVLRGPVLAATRLIPPISEAPCPAQAQVSTLITGRSCDCTARGCFPPYKANQQDEHLLLHSSVSGPARSAQHTTEAPQQGPPTCSPPKNRALGPSPRGAHQGSATQKRLFRGITLRWALRTPESAGEGGETGQKIKLGTNTFLLKKKIHLNSIN